MLQQDVAASNISSTASVDMQDTVIKENPQQTRKGARFWALFSVLSFAALLPALEAAMISTILPEIAAQFGRSGDYIWILHAHSLTAVTLKPMFGQLANVFGRRWPMICSTAVFVLGSGICGGATNMAMLIAGRAVQGVGGSGIFVIGETIVGDLVPLRERGNYFAIRFTMISAGTAFGPLFGGLLVSYSTWRWAFYLGLPIGSLVLVLLFVFLQVNYDNSRTLAAKISSIDWLGMAIFIGASSSVLISLSWAGGRYSWSSYEVFVPLVVGVVALVGFVALEASPFVANPMIPLYLFANPITAVTFVLFFIEGMMIPWTAYFLPVYFQVLLPGMLTHGPAAIAGGLLLAKFGRYKPIIVVSFSLRVVGTGLFLLLDENSSTGAWVGFQIIKSIGGGLAVPTLMPAFLAPLTDKDTAIATATSIFVYSFGNILGAAIASTIFSSRAAQLAGSGAISSNATVAAEFMAGGAYQHATAKFIDSLSIETRAQVVMVQRSALQRLWQVGIAFAALGLIAAAMLKEVPLRKELNSEFGMIEKDKRNKEMVEITAKEASASTS